MKTRWERRKRGGNAKKAPVKGIIGSTACVYWTLWAEGKGKKGGKGRQELLQPCVVVLTPNFFTRGIRLLGLSVRSA